MDYDFIIIGAGITGVSLGRLLQLKGVDNFIILESNSEAGGLCRTKNIKGHIVDIGGGHFLDSKYPEVYKFIFEHLPKKEFNEFERISKVKIGDYILDYPFELNLWQLPEEECKKYVLSLESIKNLKNKSIKNFEEYVKFNFGNLIAEKYMIPYNKKIWGVDLKYLDTDLVYKTPLTNITDILNSISFKKPDPSKIPSHFKFYSPKKGGFQTIFNSIYEKISDKVVLNYQIKKIKKDKDRWIIDDNYRSKVVINTAPWPSLFSALGSPQELKNDFDNLKSNSIVVSLFEEKKINNWHWIYIPDEEVESHRKIYINNFYPESMPNGIWGEVNIMRWPGKDNKWSNNKKPIFEHINEFAYPIPSLRHRESMDNILNYYKSKNLFGIGRWGTWSHKNADVCIHDCIKFVEDLI